MYAYVLPGAHLVNYLYQLFEDTRKNMIRLKRPQKSATITKYRATKDDRISIIDTFKFTYQFGVFQGLIKLLEGEVLKVDED